MNDGIIIFSFFCTYIFIMTIIYFRNKKIKKQKMNEKYLYFKEKYKNVYRLAKHKFDGDIYFQKFQNNKWKNVQRFIDFDFDCDDYESIQCFFIECIEKENNKINYNVYEEIK